MVQMHQFARWLDRDAFHIEFAMPAGGPMPDSLAAMGETVRIFSAARFRPAGPGLCVVLSARSNLQSMVSLCQVEPDSPPGEIEEVAEFSMLTTAAKVVEGVGRDQHLWQMEANLFPVDAVSEYGVFLRGSGAPREDFCDIRVLYFPYP
jgi:hypothetical protein